jgi:hypothetical protein
LCQKVDFAKNVSWTYITLWKRHSDISKISFLCEKRIYLILTYTPTMTSFKSIWQFFKNQSPPLLSLYKLSDKMNINLLFWREDVHRSVTNRRPNIKPTKKKREKKSLANNRKSLLNVPIFKFFHLFFPILVILDFKPFQFSFFRHYAHFCFFASGCCDNDTHPMQDNTSQRTFSDRVWYRRKSNIIKLRQRLRKI